VKRTKDLVHHRRTALSRTMDLSEWDRPTLAGTTMFMADKMYST